jgi:epoxyqueuosine reductase QueG
MKESIQHFIQEFLKGYKAEKRTKTDWKEPLVAFAEASDPLFLKLRDVVGRTHALPADLLEDAETVISYFVPFKEEIALSNRGERICSKEWAISYIETNKLIADLNQSLSKELEKSGHESVILPPTHNFDEKRLISDWSHKHVAFIAGLGRFGLHHMLITEKGCCGRLGSLITTARIKPTQRPRNEFCLYKHDKSCGKCVENCVFQALKVDSFHRHRCYEICLSNAKLYSELGLADVCGKCICVVPCSFNNPVTVLSAVT